MINLVGYRLGEEIYESEHSIAYRAHRVSDSVPVIVKALKDEFPPPRELRKYKNEYEIASLLADRPGVGRLLGLESVHNTLVIIAEDWGAESLKSLLPHRAFSLEEVIEIGSKVAAALGEIHAAQVIHKDLNPANILINLETKEVRLIDFGISTRLSREELEFEGAEIIEGTMAYISPEQTGRMNCPVDFRTDYYALGATLYHLLTGRPPFVQEDMRKLLQCHLHDLPVAPCLIRPDIPGPLSEIVMKLLSKSPEKRYQSTLGLKTDLDICLNGLRKSGQIAPFPLGAEDVSEKLLIPHKLYGREAEIEQLLAGFSRARRGARELTLVVGFSGIGKTSLVREIYKPLTAGSGYFISGKSDPIQRNRPYNALLEAFRQLCRQLLAEPGPRLTAWRSSLLGALRQNGQVLLSLLPEFEAILGPQPVAPALPPEERQNRFHFVLEKFVGVFAKREHPLVLFLDDLQWSDGASLRLIRHLLGSSGIESLFVIGAYRDNEVDPDHPLLGTLRDIAEDRIALHRIALSPLTLEDTNDLLGDALRRPGDATRKLAELLHQKSDGNPYLLTELLEALSADELLTLDRRSGAWHWDLGQVRARGITDNAADLMVRKVQKLDPSVQTALKTGACLGNRFLERQLAIVLGERAQELLPALERSAAACLLTRNAQDPLNVEYRFTHDKVHQAAYSLIPDAEKQGVHYEIGKKLFAALPAEEIEAKPFELVHHWNLCPHLLTDPAERRELVRLNLRAGQIAKIASAFQSAHSYLQRALSFCEEENWDIAYQDTITLFIEAAEAAYLNGLYEEMEGLLSIALKRCRSLEERVKALELRIHADISRDRNAIAVETAREALAHLGIPFPKNATTLHVLASFLNTWFRLRTRQIEDLALLPVISSPAEIAAMRLMVIIGSPAYLVHPNLCALLGIKSIQFTLQHGCSTYSSMASATYGAMLCGVLSDFAQGHRFGKLALSFVEKFEDRRFKGAVMFIHANFIAHWREPLQSTLPMLREGFQSALEHGDLVYASHAATNYCYHAYFSAAELSRVKAECATYNDVLVRINRKLTLHTLNIYHQTVTNLTTDTERPTHLHGAFYDEEQKIPEHLAQNERVNLCDVYINKLALAYLFGQHGQALECAERANAYLGAIISAYLFAVHHFYMSLSLLAVAESQSRLQRRRALGKVRALLGKLRMWAKNAPENHLHKVLLIEAELARVQRRDRRAADLYDRAIQEARAHKFTNEEGIACELAARFHLARGKEDFGRAYMREARYAYLRWGATAKVHDLEQRYLWFFTEDVEA